MHCETGGHADSTASDALAACYIRYLIQVHYKPTLREGNGTACPDILYSRPIPWPLSNMMGTDLLAWPP